MSRPYTDADFASQITQDRAWRLKEISDLKAAISRADFNLRRVLLRALITICYAHWEGYVRFAARKYLDHVALRKFPYRELNRQFRRNYFLPRLGALSASKTSVLDRCGLIDTILDSEELRYSIVNDELINTMANLNFQVFSDICVVCGVRRDIFVEKATFIDVVLLKRRNSIAHGEDTFVAIDDLDEVSNETIVLMRTFGDALEKSCIPEGVRDRVDGAANSDAPSAATARMCSGPPCGQGGGRAGVEGTETGMARPPAESPQQGGRRSAPSGEDALRDARHSASQGIVQLLASREIMMRSLLILLIALTMACGAAACVTGSLLPAYADDPGKGY